MTLKKLKKLLSFFIYGITIQHYSLETNFKAHIIYVLFNSLYKVNIIYLVYKYEIMNWVK